MEILHVAAGEHVEDIRTLFKEYAATLDFDLCFQNFDKELADLPGQYSAPEGGLLLAVEEGTAMGCVAVRKLSQGICEMKRLYVRPRCRGRGLGGELIKASIDMGKSLGYSRMRLDTLETMAKAVALYRTFGFKEIEPYRYNPIQGALYMELELEGDEE